MVATKFYSGHDDDSPSINWCELAKTTPDNLLKMELNFLTNINWNVYVSNDEFFAKVKTIEEKLANEQGLHRGWFTYMELSILMPSINITKTFMEITFILGISYTAFVATIVASFFLVSFIPGNCLKSQTNKITNCTSNTDTTDDTKNIGINTHINTTATDNTIVDIENELNFIENAINNETIQAQTKNRSHPIDHFNKMAKQTISNQLLKWSNMILNQIISTKIDFCIEPMITTNVTNMNTTIDKSFMNELFHSKNVPFLSMKTEHTKFQLI